MKFKKLLLSTLISSSMFAVGCSTNKNTTTPTTETSENTSYEDSDSNSALTAQFYTEEGYKRLSAEPSDDMVDTIIDSLISKGTDLITDGIQTYGKSIVLNLLKECGFDFRDATTKTLEKIQQQLNVIENKINAMTQRQEQIHAETILGDLLKVVNETQNDYSTYVVDGLGYLANLENDETKSEEDIEAERKEYYTNTIADLTINGKPIATYVSNLADYILIPNQADQSKSIFDYYDNTIGAYDVWSTLKIKNTRTFMAYIDSVLVTCANLAKFQIYYKALGMDQATIKTYESMVHTMVTKVNAVNAFFKAKLDSLKELEDKRDNGINIYMSTGKEYSTRMATLTFDTNDGVDTTDSRQALLMDVYSNSDGSRGDSYKYALELVPDQTFVASVANDFKTYANAFCVSTYTIKDYLTYAGFHAANQDLFDKSIGLYNANIYADGHGFMSQDYEYTATYYNDRGEYTRKAIYEVDSYHNWLQEVTRTVFTQYDDSYYLCFATPDGDKQKLDGKYERVYMKDTQSTVNKKLYYNYNFYTANKLNNSGWYLHDCW